MAGHSSKGKPLPSREVAASVLKMMAPRQALKAKPVSSSKSSASQDDPSKRAKTSPADGRRDREEPQINASQLALLTAGMRPDQQAAPAPTYRDFMISLDMLGKNSLGIDVDWADGVTLLVKSVQIGAVSDWNMERGPDKALRPGDRIIAVNGVSGETIGAVAMVQECKGKPFVQLTCRTQRPRPQHMLKPFVPSLVGTEVVQRPQEDKKTTQVGKRKAPGSLYSFLPEADPELDAKAAEQAKAADPFAEPAAPDAPRLCIFLDIDGVLRKETGNSMINLEGEVLPLHLVTRKFEAEAVKSLKWLVYKTGASVVLSSGWRRNPELREEVGATLRTAGLRPLKGFTDVLEPREEVAIGPKNTEERERGPATMRLRWAERRAREISAFLRERPEVERWVALDDLDLSMADQPSWRLPETLWMAPGLVLTDAEVALTMGDARKAAEMLLHD